MPLEAEVTHPFGPVWFAIKILFTFVALLPLLHGLGQLPLMPLRRVATAFAAKDISEKFGVSLLSRLRGQTQTPSFDHRAAEVGRQGISRTVTKPDPDDWGEERRWLKLTLPALLGTATCGLMVFVVGLITPPAAWLVAATSCIGYALFCLFPPPLPPWSEVWPETRWERALLLLVATGYALRCGNALFFQGQEDAYLYHLSLAEMWLRHGQTGVQLANIYSGYALDIEHYYLWLKLLVRGTAEQNALAQLTHLTIGYGVCLAALRALGGRWLGGVKTTAMLALCLNGTLVAAMMLPKNDGFLAACALTSLYGLIASQPLYFLAGASFAMAIKPTAGMIYIVIAITAVAQTVMDGRANPARLPAWPRAVGRLLLLLSCGAALMICGFLPYAWRNWAITGDPFFPLLGELFATPYAPGLQSVIVEARPLSLSAWALLRSLVTWLASEPAFLLAVGAALVAQLSRASSQGVQRFTRWPRLIPMLLFMVAGFVLLQEAMGAYGTMVASRHFVTVLGVLATTATALLFAGCVQRRQLIAAAFLAVGIGLSYSSLDVLARELVRHLSGGNLTQQIMETKPIFRLHTELNQRLAAGASARVYAATETNISSFLTAADLWHSSMTYPAWTWRPGVSGEELGCLLRQNAVDYLITETKTKLKLGLPRGAQALMNVPGMTLWQLHPAAAGDCPP